MSEIQNGDIVQITAETHPWRGCLLVVTKVKSWGVQAYCAIPQSNSFPDIGLAFNRLKTGSFERVGRATIMRG